MANYKAEGKKIFADIGKLSEAELKAVKNYIALGYELVEQKFTKVITKEKMLEELKADEEAKSDFEKAYGIKKDEIKENAELITKLEKKYGIKTKTKAGDDIVGYHLACQVFSKWKKKKREEAKKKEEEAKKVEEVK